MFDLVNCVVNTLFLPFYKMNNIKNVKYIEQNQMKLIKYIQMFETTLLISLYFTMSCVSLPYGFLPIYNSPQTHR